MSVQMKFLGLIIVLLLPVVVNAGGWVYQLQQPDAGVLAKSGFDLAVIDYSKDGTDPERFKPSEIKAMQRRGLEVLAYLSIGEAENYRFYWDRGWVEKPDTNRFTGLAPSWLGATNPDWIGNYKVRYWDADWRENYLKPYLDRIIRQGFNGVYLDIVDGFEYWADPKSYGPGKEEFRKGDPRGREREAARRMIVLVKWIAEYGRANSRLGRKFQVFPQNADYLLRFDRGGNLLRTISGVGVEDLFYNGTRRQPRSETAYRLKTLKNVVREGKTVLCVDYVDTGKRGNAGNAERIANFVAECERYGFKPYVGLEDRELDVTNRVPGVQP